MPIINNNDMNDEQKAALIKAMKEMNETQGGTIRVPFDLPELEGGMLAPKAHLLAVLEYFRDHPDDVEEIVFQAAEEAKKNVPLLLKGELAERECLNTCHDLLACYAYKLLNGEAKLEEVTT